MCDITNKRDSKVELTTRIHDNLTGCNPIEFALALIDTVPPSALNIMQLVDLPLVEHSEAGFTLRSKASAKNL